MRTTEQAIRGHNIKEQDQRNARLKKLRKKQRAKLSQQGKSAFVCSGCSRKVTISWQSLGAETPICRKCDAPLKVVTACLNGGVLPALKGNLR